MKREPWKEIKRGTSYCEQSFNGPTRFTCLEISRESMPLLMLVKLWTKHISVHKIAGSIIIVGITRSCAWVTKVIAQIWKSNHASNFEKGCHPSGCFCFARTRKNIDIERTFQSGWLCYFFRPRDWSWLLLVSHLHLQCPQNFRMLRWAIQRVVAP